VFFGHGNTKWSFYKKTIRALESRLTCAYWRSTLLDWRLRVGIVSLDLAIYYRNNQSQGGMSQIDQINESEGNQTGSRLKCAIWMQVM
jgi:hypothetical protein